MVAVYLAHEPGLKRPLAQYLGINDDVAQLLICATFSV